MPKPYPAAFRRQALALFDDGPRCVMLQPVWGSQNRACTAGGASSASNREWRVV